MDVAIPPIIASGGIVDIGAVVDLLAGGASAIQLCSALEARGVSVLALLRQQLTAIGGGHDSLSGFLGSLRQGPATWQGAAATARDLRMDEEKAVAGIFREESKILAYVADTLVDECNRELSGGDLTRTQAIPQDLSFVTNQGNVSTFLLGHLIAEKADLKPILAESAADFLLQVRTHGLQWDFGILPKSSLEVFSRNEKYAPVECLPVPIQPVATSTIHLMGVKDLDLSRVRAVYHFSGNSARFALNSLLRECRPSADRIIGPQLLPLLRCWDERTGILAKAPLAYFYGMLCTDPIKDKWGSIWSVSEPLILCASRGFLQKPSGHRVADALVEEVNAQRRWIVEHREKAARRVRSEGFFDYCAHMLLGKPAGAT